RILVSRDGTFVRLGNAWRAGRSTGSAFAGYLATCSRVEITWFPFNDNPWIHVDGAQPDRGLQNARNESPRHLREPPRRRVRVRKRSRGPGDPFAVVYFAGPDSDGQFDV